MQVIHVIGPVANSSAAAANGSDNGVEAEEEAEEEEVETSSVDGGGGGGGGGGGSRPGYMSGRSQHTSSPNVTLRVLSDGASDALTLAVPVLQSPESRRNATR